ncbi:MAG TPA: hypothetical protein VEY71_00840 [Chitinophagales bacterium]|nr:hypothetical protein [Chitinophagales bacterium]
MKRIASAKPARVVWTKRLLVVALLSVNGALRVAAQERSLDNNLNDAMRSGNKFYAVVAVLVTIFTVLFAYMVYQDVKLSKIKKDLNSKYSNNNEQNRNA